MPAYTRADLVLLFIAVALIPAMSVLAGRSLARASGGERRLVRRYWLIIVRTVVVSLLILLAWRGAGRPFVALGLDLPIGWWGRVGFGVDAVVAAAYVYSLLLRKLSAERVAVARQRLERLRIMPRTPEEFRLFGVVAVVGSIGEELLYRGYLIWAFTPWAGLSGAAALSSLVFGLGHAYQGGRGIVRTALIGLAFALAFAATGSLWWLMVAHMTFNLAGGLFARRLQREPA